ncbi:MAG: hypothetical protein JO079_02555 [Frankiaceae bacterium]|nr:hypothetical protein [Frankiaceae bacterium]
MIRRWVGTATLAGALLLGGAPAYAAPTPPAPAECLSPNMICTYVGGTWSVESKPPMPIDDGLGNPMYAYPVLAAVFAGFGMFLGAVNLLTWLRRKRRLRAAQAG